jgi:hypothetical protein
MWLSSYFLSPLFQDTSLSFGLFTLEEHTNLETSFGLNLQYTRSFFSSIFTSVLLLGGKISTSLSMLQDTTNPLDIFASEDTELEDSSSSNLEHTKFSLSSTFLLLGGKTVAFLSILLAINSFELFTSDIDADGGASSTSNLEHTLHLQS